MGKKTTKRKTRWRALSIGEVPSDTEEDSQENTSTYRGEFPYHRPYNGKPHQQQHHQRSNGGGGAAPHYGGGTYNKYSNYSSQSTPTRNRNYHYQHNGEKYKSSRSNSTTSEPKITFNEDEYTRITTPRQDVLFKKGYLSKKKPSVAVAPTPNDGVTTSNGGVGGAPSGGSCGDSNPSTGYSSTTGGGTPEHHSQDGGEYRDGEFDQHQQFIFHNGFVDSNGIYFVNAGVPPGFEYGPMMLVGPAGQFIHPVEFYPPAPGMCFPPYAYRGKRYSTDSQAESASPNNETDSSNKTANTGNECSSSSIQSSTNGCDNGHASSSCADDQQQQQPSQDDVAVEHDVDGVATSNVVEHETASEVGANHQAVPIGLGMGTVPPGAMFPPTQFIFPAPHPGFIPYPTNHHQMYMNGIQLQSSTSVNETVESKRYKKRRRRKVSRLQNENAADADYTDETTSSSDDNDPEPTSKHDPLPKTPSTDLSSRTTTMSSEPTNSNHVDPTRTDDTNPTSTETTPTNDPPNSHDARVCDVVAPTTDSSSFVKNETTDLSSDDLSSTNHDEDEEEIRSNESDSRGPDISARDGEMAKQKDNSRHRTDLNADEVLNERRNCSERLESGTDADATDLVLSEQCRRENEQPEKEQTIDMSNGMLENHVDESRKEIESSGGENDSTEQKPSLTTIYKVDAEEFVPMSMRVQQQDEQQQLPSTNGTVDEELRAKFENYLNRNADNLEMQNAFELQIARTAANSVPETGANTPIVPVDAKRFDPEAVREFVPRNGDFVEFVVPVSKSYPPKREHFGRHEHGVTKKYYNNSNNSAHYAHDHYSGYKRRNYNDRYYQKHNYQQQQHHHRAYKEQNGYGATRNPRTNSDVVQNDARVDQAASNGTECSVVSKEESDESLITPTTPTRTNVSSTYSQTTSENEPVTCNGETCKEASIGSADKKDSESIESKGNRSRNQQEVSETTTTKKSISRTRETPAPMLNGNVSKEQTAEPTKKPHLPPGFSPKPQRTSHGHTKVQVLHATVAPLTDSAQSSPAKMKNYAQIVKKTQRAPPLEPPDRPIGSNCASKRTDGPGESDVSGLSDFSPAKSVDDEWISVPSRKKGKAKQTGKIVGGFEHVEETPRHVPRPEPVVQRQEKQTKSVGVKNKIEKQSSTKETSRSSVKHVEKKIPEGSPEKVREVRETKVVSRKHEAVNVNGNEDPISKEAPSIREAVKVERCEKQIDVKEKRAEKVPESVRKVEEKLDDVQIETPTRKSKKTKMKSKKSNTKVDSRSPKTSTTQSSPLAFDIVGSIDKLGKRTDDETKTNVEMSLEIDKLIQRGLYANMEQTLRSFGGDTDAFLSIVDPSVDFMSPKALDNGTMSPSADAKQNLLDQHVMRTLSECQRMFAYKTMKEVDVKSPTRDVEVATTTTSKNESRKVDPKASKSHTDETKSAKKSKKGKQKHRSPNREACVEINSSAVEETIQTENKHVEQATTSTETVCHKKETLDMDTVNAILRDLSAERKRELLLDGFDEESRVCIESGSLIVESDFQTALPESCRTTEREDVETVIVPESCELTEEEEGEDGDTERREERERREDRGDRRSESVERTSAVLSGPWTEDEKSACRELGSDSVEQISDLCASSELSSPDQRQCIYYSVEDLNDASPGSNIEAHNDHSDRSSAVITQEPHVDRSKHPVLEDDCSVVSSPDDPRSTSSEEQNMSITEAVRHWLHETKEKSPDVEVLKSPEKLKLESVGRTRRFLRSDTDDSDDDGDDEGGDEEARERVARRTGPKNVKGNPLFAASVDTGREPAGIDADDVKEEDERGAGSIDAEDRRVASSNLIRTEPENRNDGTDDDDERCSPSVEAGLEVGESFESFTTPRIEYNIAANVVNIAREIANTVNPVVNGIGLGRDGAVPNGYEITESGIKVRESIVRVINGATVRDVAVIRRTVSENGSRPFDDGFDDDGGAVDTVKKSRSCIEMTDFSAAPTMTPTSAETQLNGDVSASSPVADLLDCWENDLNVGSYRTTTMTTSPLIIATDMNLSTTNLDNDVERRNNNNNIAATVAIDDNDDVNLNSFDDAKRAKEKLNVDENGEDVLEAYESVYGTNIDYLEIKRKVYETAQRQIPPNQNLLFPPGGDRPVPCGAICCSVM